ncbi:MAG: hypothetical protein ACOCP8_04710 [archaeon]
MNQKEIILPSVVIRIDKEKNDIKLSIKESETKQYGIQKIRVDIDGNWYKPEDLLK